MTAPSTRSLCAAAALLTALSLASRGHAQVGWQHVSSRTNHGMAVDQAQGRIIAFGGRGSVGLLDETVAVTATGIERLSPPTNPGALEGAPMVFLPGGTGRVGGIRLFGGVRGAGLTATTWTFSGNGWSQDNPIVSPPPRRGHAMEYYPPRDTMILFGGFDAAGQGLSDTWEFDGTNWTQLSPAGSPPPLNSYAMAYDAATQGIVLFSAVGFFPPVPITSVYDGTNWNAQTPAQSPPPHLGHTMTADPTSGVLLFGGERWVTPTSLDTLELDETWRYRAGAWTRLLPSNSPPPRRECQMITDPTTGMVRLHGGWFNVNYERAINVDTWDWDGTTWTELGGTKPRPLTRTTMAFDHNRGHLVMHGGGLGFDWFAAFTSPFTFEYVDGSWRRIATASFPSIEQHSMAFDKVRNVMVLFGGLVNDFQVNTTYEFDGTSWALRNPPNSPPLSVRSAMTFDEANGVTLLFGAGFTGGGNATWTYDGTTWTQRFPATQPPGAQLSSLVWSTARNQALLIAPTGGSNGGIWGWTGTDWQLVDATQPPAGPFVFDRQRQLIVAMSGHEWADAAGGWVLRNATTLPAYGEPPAFGYDEVSGRCVAYGGKTPQGIVADTWTYGPLRPASSEPFGAGCPDVSGRLYGLRPVEREAWLGSTFRLRVEQLSPAAPVVPPTGCFGDIGFSDQFWSGLPLPLDLGFVGMPGCRQLIEAWRVDLFFGADWSIPLPADPYLAGATIYLQAFPAAPTTNPFGLITTDALRVTLGNP